MPSEHFMLRKLIGWRRISGEMDAYNNLISCRNVVAASHRSQRALELEIPQQVGTCRSRPPGPVVPSGHSR